MVIVPGTPGQHLHKAQLRPRPPCGYGTVRLSRPQTDGRRCELGTRPEPANVTWGLGRAVGVRLIHLNHIAATKQGGDYIAHRTRVAAALLCSPDALCCSRLLSLTPQTDLKAGDLWPILCQVKVAYYLYFSHWSCILSMEHLTRVFNQS